MESRDTTKLEYFKQPHVIAIVVIIIVVVIGALFTAMTRVRQTAKLSNMETFEACSTLIDDENLCRFAANFEANQTNPHIITTTETAGPKVIVSKEEIESIDKHKTTVYSGQEEVEASIVIDDNTYVKDVDLTWAHYKDPNYQKTDQLVKYDFGGESSADVLDFKNNYHAENKEACGDLTCFKYKITSSEDQGSTTYLWFDDKDFLQRRVLLTDNESTTNILVEYRPVKIEAPSPTKEVKQEDIQQYLEELPDLEE